LQYTYAGWSLGIRALGVKSAPSGSIAKKLQAALRDHEKQLSAFAISILIAPLGQVRAAMAFALLSTFFPTSPA
jgi:hypothetical protein